MVGMSITVLKSEKSFDFILGDYSRVKRNGDIQIGKGWPDFRMRWCTGDLKRDIMRKHLRGVEHILYQGIAFDERERTLKNKDGRNIQYPLVDWNITEAEALEYCYSKGFRWNGLYEKFARVSCYCCPLQRIGELETIYREFPELWADMRKMDAKSWRKFRNDYTLAELERKFDLKQQQLVINL